MAKVPNIRSTGNVPPGELSSWLKEMLDSTRQWVQTRDPQETRVGDPLDKFLTRREALDLGVLARLPGGGFVGGGGGGGAGPGGIGGSGYTPDLTPPPTPTGLVASAGISYLFITFDPPIYTQGHGHALTNIYGAIWLDGDTEPTFGDPRTKLIDTISGPGTIHAYPTNPATRWCVWIKFKSVDGVESAAPAGGTHGAQATTGQDVSALLQVLTGQITQSQLFGALGARIDLIDGAAGLAGSVNARIQAVNTSLTAATTVPAYSAVRAYAAGELAVYSGNLYRALVATTGNLPTDASKWKLIGAYSSLGPSVALLFTDYLTATETGSAISSATTGLVSTTALATALGSYVTTSTLTTDYYTRTATDSAIATATTGLVSSTALTTALSSYVTTATLISNYYTATAVNSAIASATSSLVSTTALTTALGSYVTTAALTSNYYTATATNSAIATSTGTVTARLDNFGGSGSTAEARVSTESSARVALDGAVHALYTVRVQTTAGGRTIIGGFGLAATPLAGGGSEIEFGVRADRFYIGAPSSATGVADVLPFVVQTADQTVNGVLVPKGVYMDAAFIKNLTALVARLGNAWIDNAMVANLSAAKLTVGDGTVGGDLKSTVFTSGSVGWRIRPDGTAEFSGVVARGTIVASAGAIGGITIGSTAVYSTGFVAGTSGFRIHSDGSAEFNNLYARGNIQANSLVVGGSPAVSGTTMTGTGGVINTGGTFALGNSTTNISFNGATMTLNGAVVKAENLSLGSFAVSVSPTSVSSYAFGSGPTSHGNLTATATGGTDPCTFSWFVAAKYNDPSGSSGDAYVSGTSGLGGSVCGLSTSGQSDNSRIEAVYRCVATDALGRTAIYDTPVSVLRGIPP